MLLVSSRDVVVGHSQYDGMLDSMNWVFGHTLVFRTNYRRTWHVTVWSHNVRSVDEVFKSLADPGRRALLDALREREGLTLGEMCAVLPEMTRFGVMKHLRVLEAAHLVLTERAGRTKLHYLNPVPIREIHDRWISGYTEPFAAGLLALRASVETDANQQGV